MSLTDHAMSQVSFQIKRGLGEFGYSDHYAVLGLSVDASVKDIRKRYLTLARLLHPDSCPNPTTKEHASQFLSKLVNPAYQALSQDKERTDYTLLLKLVGQRACLEYTPDKVTSKSAQTLLAATDFEKEYVTLIDAQAQRQYQQLETAFDLVEELSELNLVLLMRREASPEQARAAAPAHTSAPSSPSPQARKASTPQKPANPQKQTPPEVAVAVPSKQPVSSPAPPTDSFIEQYFRRAEDLLAKKLYQEAIKELRDAEKYRPDSSRCHSLMGKVYLQQGKSTTMAKVSFKRALRLDPENSEARQGMAEVTKLEAKSAKKPVPGKTAPDSERKGLFGLFKR